ncbi:biotin--[acetyl-CoA-carboxylase] ligase [Helicobacter heilmannii]|uniref:Biotin-protein ligase n=1 Tax=Helicobacter heilmannii TaxID=35817 RepID=A0A0K2XWA6_HELHE|nr:biotin--[acetyl-CoA-carboxylase] ligase [Helicobacter heilmannii]CCM11668.1 Biotin-protein ligase [Helicobacter heilmannii ASB1.4]CRF45785.1 Biotin--protein ligase [Helicobacter heilmannii]CRF48055.1 Biotin--protein ligase [Helicobacter heilmannii]CRF51416.1 Biotin--protein ligase [Helicobacter heilmannii]CRI33808.1 Biotin-protein ligase [Helicobacter heilmannii]
MQILEFGSLPSTQVYLAEQIRNKSLKSPICVWAHKQSAGIGSRGQAWESVDKALTFSFALNIDTHIPKQSLSLYFGYLFKQALHSLGHTEVWLKWPNDLYVGDAKVGGVMSQIYKDIVICGIGLNIHARAHASVALPPKEALHAFLESLQPPPTWADIFKAYKIDFERTNSGQFFKHESGLIPLSQATMRSDGGLEIAGQVYYSRR